MEESPRAKEKESEGVEPPKEEPWKEFEMIWKDSARWGARMSMRLLR